MPVRWVPPEPLLTYQGVTIYHAYDEDSDVVLCYWYTTSEDEDPASEFNVRDLPGYNAREDTGWDSHARVIRQAIEAGLLRTDES